MEKCNFCSQMQENVICGPNEKRICKLCIEKFLLFAFQDDEDFSVSLHHKPITCSFCLKNSGKAKVLFSSMEESNICLSCLLLCVQYYLRKKSESHNMDLKTKKLHWLSHAEKNKYITVFTLH